MAPDFPTTMNRIVDALRGKKMNNPLLYLYWDYGHNLARYDQAVRLGNWKGIRLGHGNPLELYDLAVDIGETNDLASEHPDVVAKIDRIMEDAVTPSGRYQVGVRYRGK